MTKNNTKHAIVRGIAAVAKKSTHTHRNATFRRWREWKICLIFGTVFFVMGLPNIQGQSGQEPTLMTISPCDGTNGTPPGTTKQVNLKGSNPNAHDSTRTIIPVCCPTPTTCPKKTVTVCYYGLEAGSQYKFDAINIRDVSFATYTTYTEADHSAKGTYLSSKMFFPFTPQTITAAANGNVCINYCLPTGSAEEYTFVVYPLTATTSLDYLYQGNFNASNTNTPGLGWVWGSNQVWCGSGSNVYHVGNTVKFQQYSPAPGQSCPIDLCNCQ